MEYPEGVSLQFYNRAPTGAHKPRKSHMTLPIPSFNNTQRATAASGKLLPEEYFDFSLVQVQYEFSQWGTHVMDVIARVDNGEHAGGTAGFRLQWGDDAEKAEQASAKLKALAESCRTDDGSVGDGGFIWSEDVPDFEAFVKQFQQSPPLRFRAKVYHSNDLKFFTPGSDKGDYVKPGRLFNKEAERKQKELEADGFTVSRYTKAMISVGTAEPPRAASELAAPAASGDGAPAAPQRPGVPSFGATPSRVQPSVWDEEEMDSDKLPF